MFTAGTHTGISFTYGLTQDAANRIDATVDTEWVQDRIAELFAAGVHTGITFTYSDNLNALSAAVNFPTFGGNLASNLVLNSFNISGTGNISNTGTMTATGTISTSAGNISAFGSVSAGTTISATQGLGANLPLNSRDITGTGNINITGTVTATTVTAKELNGKTLGLGPDATDGKSGISIVTTANDNDEYDLFTIAAFHNGGAANYGNSSVYVRSRGTPASPLAVQTGDFIHKMAFIAATSPSTSVKNAEITVEVDTGTINATQAPAKISFKTMTNAGTLVEGLTLDSASVIGVNANQALVAGAGSGQVNTSSIVSYVRIKVGTTAYAIPLYAIRP